MAGVPEQADSGPKTFADILNDVALKHKIGKMSWVDNQLWALIQDYRERFELPTDTEYFSTAHWYGVFTKHGKLMATVGFQEMQVGHRRLLFICDFVSRRGMEGSRALAKLTAFIEDIPIRLRGLVLTENSQMTKMLTHRGKRKNKRAWRTYALLVESDPKE